MGHPVKKSDAKPNPVAWKGLWRPDGSHRRVWCARYEECLKWAISADVPNWTCKYCEVREDVSMDWVELKEESRRCLALIWATEADLTGGDADVLRRLLNEPGGWMNAI